MLCRQPQHGALQRASVATNLRLLTVSSCCTAPERPHERFRRVVRLQRLGSVLGPWKQPLLRADSLVASTSKPPETQIQCSSRPARAGAQEAPPRCCLLPLPPYLLPYLLPCLCHAPRRQSRPGSPDSMSRRSSVRIGGTIGSGGRAARLLGSEVRLLLPEARCELAYDLNSHAASAKLNLYRRQVRQHYRGAVSRGGSPWVVAVGSEQTA